MKTTPWMILLLAATLSAPALAQRAKTTIPNLDAEGKPGEIARAQFRKALEKFDRVDEDKNGTISKDEASRQFSEYEMAHFDEKDKNSDGKLSWEEFLGHDRWKKDALK